MTRLTIALLPAFAALCACGPSDAPSAAASGAGPAPSAAPAPPPKPAADPMKDVTAWNALSEPERASRAREYVTKTDAGNSIAVERAREFLTDRASEEGLSALAKAAAAKGSIAPWVHERLGEKNVGPDVDACLAQCRTADDCGNDMYVSLREMRSSRGGSWWADAEGQKDVLARCAALRKEEEFLKTPYGEGVDNWVRRQRAVEVMKDAPAIHGVAGPYLVFVSLDSDVSKEGAKTKPEDIDPNKPAAHRSLSEVKPEELARAKKILDRNVALMADFYEGWMKEMGPIFGLERYGPENTDMKTLFKMNVFMNEAEYKRFNAKNGNTFANENWRAFYGWKEPRFITTYDGGGAEFAAYTDQIQCHEATHQLVHFYTWDLTRKDLGREPTFEESGAAHALWSNEGFAEFFSSFAMKDGKRVWMQPLESRIFELWLLADVCKAKKWKPFEIKELLRMRTGGELAEASRSRAVPGSSEVPLAQSYLGNLFYAKAWSFVSFLWYAEEGGKPKWRDRFIEYLKREMHLRFETSKSTNVPSARYATLLDFRKIMGIERTEKDAKDMKDAAIEAFEKEWQAYEAKLVADHKKPFWDARKAAVLKTLETAK